MIIEIADCAMQHTALAGSDVYAFSTSGLRNNDISHPHKQQDDGYFHLKMVILT